MGESDTALLFLSKTKYKYPVYIMLLWTKMWCHIKQFVYFDFSRLAEEMSMPSLPEMLFGDNVLRIQHKDGFGIEFNAIDALKRVNNMEDAVKVACAQEWQESRQDKYLLCY